MPIQGPRPGTDVPIEGMRPAAEPDRAEISAGGRHVGGGDVAHVDGNRAKMSAGILGFSRQAVLLGRQAAAEPIERLEPHALRQALEGDDPELREAALDRLATKSLEIFQSRDETRMARIHGLMKDLPPGLFEEAAVELGRRLTEKGESPGLTNIVPNVLMAMQYPTREERIAIGLASTNAKMRQLAGSAADVYDPAPPEGERQDPSDGATRAIPTLLDPLDVSAAEFEALVDEVRGKAGANPHAGVLADALEAAARSSPDFQARAILQALDGTYQPDGERHDLAAMRIVHRLDDAQLQATFEALYRQGGASAVARLAPAILMGGAGDPRAQQFARFLASRPPGADGTPAALSVAGQVMREGEQARTDLRTGLDRLLMAPPPGDGRDTSRLITNVFSTIQRGLRGDGDDGEGARVFLEDTVERLAGEWADPEGPGGRRDANERKLTLIADSWGRTSERMIERKDSLSEVQSRSRQLEATLAKMSETTDEAEFRALQETAREQYRNLNLSVEAALSLGAEVPTKLAKLKGSLDLKGALGLQRGEKSSESTSFEVHRSLAEKAKTEINLLNREELTDVVTRVAESTEQLKVSETSATAGEVHLRAVQEALDDVR